MSALFKSPFGNALALQANALTEQNETRKCNAWNNAAAVPGQPDLRRDCDGRLIRWSEYGQLTSLGWEIDHITPTRLGGLNTLGNVRARHWHGNRSAGGILGNALLNAGRKGD